jgi:hypothetical protein
MPAYDARLLPRQKVRSCPRRKELMYIHMHGLAQPRGPIGGTCNSSTIASPDASNVFNRQLLPARANNRSVGIEFFVNASR